MPTIRLAPRLAAASYPLARGITLHMEAITPAAFKACAADLMASLPPDVTPADRDAAAFTTGLRHFCVEIEDADGARHPFSDALMDEVLAADPRLVWFARQAVDKHLAAGALPAAEGNGSAPSSSGEPGAE